MTDASMSLRAVAYPRATESPRTISGLRSIRLPAHLGVLMGLSAGAYALFLAAVTGLQSLAESQLAADRAQATAALTRQVGELAVGLASKVVGQALTDDARVRATVDAFLDDLEQQATS